MNIEKRVLSAFATAFVALVMHFGTSGEGVARAADDQCIAPNEVVQVAQPVLECSEGSYLCGGTACCTMAQECCMRTLENGANEHFCAAKCD